MAAAGISSARQRNPRGFMALLSSAACEWFLIFLLLVDAALSYLLTKFAHYCELQTPCLLCSRLDHVFGKKKPGYYQSLLCNNHREEISSLIYCHAHGNLADVRGMCEECFVSLAADNSLTMNKAWMDMFKSNNSLPSSSGPSLRCSCCNKSWKARANAQTLVQLSPVGFGASKVNVKPPLPRTRGRIRFSRRDSFKKIRDRLSGPMSTCSKGGKIGVDHLSQVGYTELKITSDSESEVPFSDEEGGYYGLCRTNHSNVRNGGRPVKPVVQTHQSSESDQFDSDQSMQFSSNKGNILISHKSDSFMTHGLEELGWEQFSPKHHLPIMPEVISLDGMSQLSAVSEVPRALGEISKPNISHINMSGLSLLSDRTSLTNLPSSSTAMKILENLNMTDSNHEGQDSVINHTSITIVSPDARALVVPNHINLVDAPSLTYRDCETTHMPADQTVPSGSTNIGEDAKSFLQISAPEMDFSKIASPRAHVHHGDIQKRVLQASISMEKSESGSESVDGFMVSEIEGESIVDRLKRQVEHDHKALKDLCKELEEERNAASIAANQAMAMITRLQEEKAALHMEALQYLRMMEEQSEYDMEALEKANDLLAEKDKEMQDLEVQLELYKSMCGDQEEEPVTPDLQKEDFKLIGSNGVVENHTIAQV